MLTRELLGDFPFVGAAEKAHALALLLLPFCRDLIDGPAPLHLIEKPTPGTGATLLVDALLFPATGRPVSAMTEGRDEDEWRKRIFAKLRSGPVAVNIDNLRRKLDSAALSSALTAFPLWEDRLLGQSEIIRVPVRCAWAATGNNPSLSNEMTRRTVRIRIDAKTDRPWLRNEYRHPDLRAWMTANRGKLVWAALVLVRAWLAAGRPPGQRTLGMFDKWARTIGGIFEVVGIEGFLGNLEELYEEADTDGAAWRSFVAAWWERFGDQEKVVADLLLIASEDSQLNLGDGEQKSRGNKLGYLLRANRDRVFTVLTGGDNQGGEVEMRLRVERSRKCHGTARWQLCQLG